jgi:hypothetical protein
VPVNQALFPIVKTSVDNFVNKSQTLLNSTGQPCGAGRTQHWPEAKNAYKSSLYDDSEDAEMSTGIFTRF